MSMTNSALVVLVGLAGFIIVLALICYIIQAIAYWQIFTRAGEAGWKGLIPVYSLYVQYKITWKPAMFAAMAACVLIGSFMNNMDGIISLLGSIVLLAGSVISWIACHKLSLAFGHGIGFTLGLILLNPIFLLILAFSGDQYQGPQ